MDEFIEIYAKGLETFGWELQADLCIEEMAELTKALIKFKRDPSEGNRLAIVEELADVTHTTNQMKLKFSSQQEQNVLMPQKIKKLVNKIQEHIDAGKPMKTFPFPYQLYFAQGDSGPNPAELWYLTVNEIREKHNLGIELNELQDQSMDELVKDSESEKFTTGSKNQEDES